jgi:hypothetical protein
VFYRFLVLDVVAIRGIPAFAAATTVPNIIAAERIAAKTNPAVFISIPSDKEYARRNRRLPIVGRAAVPAIHLRPTLP